MLTRQVTAAIFVSEETTTMLLFLSLAWFAMALTQLFADGSKDQYLAYVTISSVFLAGYWVVQAIKKDAR